VWGDTLEGVKAIKSDSDSDSDEQNKVARFCEEETGDDTAELATKKGRQGFQEKKLRGRPGCRPCPSDATVSRPWGCTCSNPMHPLAHCVDHTFL